MIIIENFLKETANFLLKMKDTYDFESKARARVELKNFVHEKYRKPKDRKNIRVLTLLGHEDHELKQVWDPLGVPRENITVIEYLPKVHEIIKDNNLGVNLFPKATSLEDYIESSSDKSFDIINIDETSNFNKRQRETLAKIAYNQMLGDNGILATWYLGKRENKSTRGWFEEVFSLDDEEYGCYKEKVRNRSNIISRMISSIFIRGTLNYDHHPLFDEEYFDFFISEYTEKLFPEVLDLENFSVEKASEFITETFKEFFDNHSFAEISIRERINDILLRNLLPKYKIHQKILEEILYFQHTGSYFSTRQKRFKYVSDNGSPMLVDFNNFEHLDLKRVINLEIDKGQYRIFWGKNIKKAEKTIEKFLDARKKCGGHLLEERIHLGSSFKEKSRKRTISDKEEAYLAIGTLYEQHGQVDVKLFNENFNSDFSNAQISAFIAHHTMRNPNREKKVNSQDIVDDLVLLGEKKVKEKYQLTKGQLSAIKAHITMGSYEKPLERTQYKGATIEGRGNIDLLIQRLEKRFGKLENIPKEILNHHKIRIF